MKLELTKKQYRRLLDLAYLFNCIVYSSGFELGMSYF